MYTLIIVTPESVIYKGSAISVIVPGADGYFEMLKDHIPILAALKEGSITVTNEKKVKIFYKISSGFVEMSRNHCRILADSVERIESA